MIARVRIAPIEKWCDHYKADSPVHLIAGMEVKIDTDSMTEKQPLVWRKSCGGKWWKIDKESQREIAKIIGGPCGNAFCEHMLEMD